MNTTSRWNNIPGNIALVLSLIPLIGVSLGHAQETATAIQSTQPDSIVQITADAQGLPPVSPTDLPRFGTFWVMVPGYGGNLTALPYPCMPGSPEGLPVYDITGNIFLVDDTGGQVLASGSPLATQASRAMITSALETQANTVLNLIEQIQGTAVNQQMMAMGMDVPSFDSGGGGGGTNGFYSDSFNFNPNYGTNLWIRFDGISSGNAVGILSNSPAAVKLELQYTTDLTQPWQSAGWFVYGSELTNWTPFSVPAISSSNLFLRVRSWADDGSGLPIWWQLQYFGYVGVNPNAPDPANDGWSNWQKFQMGLNPNVPTTPPTPQGLTATYNVANGTALVTWQPSPVPVTGYTVKDSDGNTFNFPAGTDSFTDNISSDAPDPWNYGDIDTTLQIQAHYTVGDSLWSAPVPVERTRINGGLVAGPQGTAYVAISALPPNTAAIRLTEWDYYPNTPVRVTNFDISISNFTNGLCPLPNNTPSGDGNYRQNPNYGWVAQAVGTNGLGLTANVWLGEDYTSPQDGYRNCWLAPPFFDGRAQLKQNLIFQLRAAVADRPFQYTEIWTNYGNEQYPVSSPATYAYAGYYYFWQFNSGEYEPFLDSFLPFEENYFDRNFVFDTSRLDSNGRTTTGVGGQYNYSGGGGLTIKGSIPPTSGNYLELQAAYHFVAPPTNNAVISSLMATNQTRWLSTYALDSSEYFLTPEIGVTNWYETDWQTYYNTFYAILPNSANYFGLPFLSDAVAWGNTGGAMDTLYANSYIENEDGYFYPEVVQPKFQTVEYDYWVAPNFWYDTFTNGTDYPGLGGLSLTHTNPVLITAVGNPNFQIACYAKLWVTNSFYNDVYGFLQQYFDQAYEVDTNSNVTANPTGVLSPYGQFFATEPGAAALVTMPDIDTGQRGTNIVYAIKLVLDKNHDGFMDTSFSGADATSASSPFQFWANNNYDRWDDDGYFGTPEQDDQQIAFCPAAPITPTPDCNYSNISFYAYGQSYRYRAIPCTRDLEDFARLWVCGITTNLLAALPSGSTVTLNWGDVGSPNSGNPTIDLFAAADADGGIGYLTNETVAAQQTNLFQCPYAGRLGPGQSIQLNASGWLGNHFIWCGVSNGTGGLNLTIADGNGNVLAQSTAYIQIVDIKQMYERYTVGDNSSVPPTNTASLVTEGLPAGMSAFQYTLPTDPSTPYILLVHGYNMAVWEKDRYAETAFKRLYWLGYQGRFGAFNWPTAEHALQFGSSEMQAWLSAQGLLKKLNDLNAEYPGHVYLAAHSLGNVVAGEALLLATNQVVNTYVAMQGAVSAHAYDPTTTAYTIPVLDDGGEPDCYAHYWTNGAPCYFNTTAGAGTYVNFFNTNDWALRVAWLGFQDSKPTLYPSYLYIPPGSYFKNLGLTELYFPDNRYEIFNAIIQARSYAIGMQANVGGAFMAGTNYNQVPLPSVWPPDDGGYTAHVWHSAEFRSDNAQRWQFWNQVLVKMKLKLQ